MSFRYTKAQMAACSSLQRVFCVHSWRTRLSDTAPTRSVRNMRSATGMELCKVRAIRSALLPRSHASVPSLQQVWWCGQRRVPGPLRPWQLGGVATSSSRRVTAMTRCDGTRCCGRQPLLASQPHTMHGHRQLLRHGMHLVTHVLHVLLQDTPSRRPSRPTRAWEDAPEQRRGGGRTPAQSWDEDFDAPSRMDRASRCAGQARRCSATWCFDSGFWVRESSSAQVCQG